MHAHVVPTARPATASQPQSLSHPATTVELAEFKLVAGTTAAQLADANAAMEAFLATCPGFVSRRLLREGDTLADLVEWRDIDAAQAAMQAANESPQAGAYFRLIEMASVRMRHFRVER